MYKKTDVQRKNPEQSSRTFTFHTLHHFEIITLLKHYMETKQQQSKRVSDSNRQQQYGGEEKEIMREQVSSKKRNSVNYR